jgi:hypothetical protein
MKKGFVKKTFVSILYCLTMIAPLCIGAGQQELTDGTISPARSISGQSSPLYMLIYPHSDLILWGHDHFLQLWD